MTLKEIFFATDKLLHAAACFIITVLFAAIFAAQTSRLLIGTGYALAFAFGKEVYDFAKKAPLLDQIFDFGYDIIGIVIALFCLTALGC